MNSENFRKFIRVELVFPFIWWTISLATSSLAFVVISTMRDEPLTASWYRWDAGSYRDLSNFGYLNELPTHEGLIAQNRNAFFPVFPMLVRVSDYILPGGDTPAFLAVNIIASFVAVVVVYKLARLVLSPEQARYATALFAVFPFSFVYFWFYSEAVAVLFLSIGILLLVQGRPWIAAFIFAIAGLTRPNALFIGFSVPIYFLTNHFMKEKPRLSSRYLKDSCITLVKSIGSGIIVSSGFFVFVELLDYRTGVNSSWFRTQREGWGESVHPFSELVSLLHSFIVGNINPRIVLVAISAFYYFFLITALVIYMWRLRFSPISVALVVPSIIVCGFALSNDTAVASLRFALVAIPSFIAIPYCFNRKVSITLATVSVPLMFVLCVIHGGDFIVAAP